MSHPQTQGEHSQEARSSEAAQPGAPQHDDQRSSAQSVRALAATAVLVSDFLFLGAAPCTDWLGDSVARDDKGFVLTGSDAGAGGLLETSVPGVYAAGDVRADSIERCATAVGEGAMVVRFVHERLSGVAA